MSTWISNATDDAIGHMHAIEINSTELFTWFQGEDKCAFFSMQIADLQLFLSLNAYKIFVHCKIDKLIFEKVPMNYYDY